MFIFSIWWFFDIHFEIVKFLKYQIRAELYRAAPRRMRNQHACWVRSTSACAAYAKRLRIPRALRCPTLLFNGFQFVKRISTVIIILQNLFDNYFIAVDTSLGQWRNWVFSDGRAKKLIVVNKKVFDGACSHTWSLVMWSWCNVYSFLHDSVVQCTVYQVMNHQNLHDSTM